MMRARGAQGAAKKEGGLTPRKFARCPVVRPAIGRSWCDALQTSWRYPLALPPPLAVQSLRVADVGSA
jgi:hypothetical protein